MSTIAKVIDRLMIQWLTPADDQSAQVRLGASITDAAGTSILLGGFTIPEDEALLRQGSILSIERELVRVVSYDQTAGTIEVTRGEYSSTPTAHATPLLMELNPPYPRYTVFEAVADNIITLYPRLFTARTEYLTTVSSNVLAVPDELAVEITSMWQGDFTSVADVDGEMVDYHPAASGRAIILATPMSTAWVRYKRRMGKATSEDDTLEDLGVDDRWVNIVMAGAAADLLAGRDIAAVESEWIKSVLEAENIRVGSRMSIAGGLRQYRNMLLDDASKEMKGEYKVKVHMNQAGMQVG